MEKVVIFDCDGTLVDVSGIRHLIAKGLKDRNFDEFHKQSVNCPPIDYVAQAARDWADVGMRVFQVTARQEKYRSLTSFWIADNKIPSDRLVMRPDGDFRADADVKRDIINGLLKNFEIVMAYDDNPSIVSLWEEFGIGCVVVPGWSE